jgi:hypothetical protein
VACGFIEKVKTSLEATFVWEKKEAKKLVKNQMECEESKGQNYDYVMLTPWSSHS